MGKNNNGPESKFLDPLKGKQIGIIFVGEDPKDANFFRCKLLWVDTYSYGVEVAHPTGAGLALKQATTERLIPKQAVQQMFLVQGTGYERGE